MFHPASATLAPGRFKVVVHLKEGAALEAISGWFDESYSPSAGVGGITQP